MNTTSRQPVRSLPGNISLDRHQPVAMFAQVGDKVAWDTPMSGRSDGEVVEVIPFLYPEHNGREVVWVDHGAVEFRVRFEDGTETVSDLRQRGWRFLGAA